VMLQYLQALGMTTIVQTSMKQKEHGRKPQKPMHDFNKVLFQDINL
jgi:hypothetical protein